MGISSIFTRNVSFRHSRVGLNIKWFSMWARSPPASRGLSSPEERPRHPTHGKRPEQYGRLGGLNQLTFYLLYAERVKRRPDADLLDAPGGCLSSLLGVCPRLGASRAAPGESSAEASPRWGGEETKHTIPVQQSFGRSSARGALAPRLALEEG